MVAIDRSGSTPGAFCGKEIRRDNSTYREYIMDHMFDQMNVCLLPSLNTLEVSRVTRPEWKDIIYVSY